jgi:hypothetical protein
MEKPIPGTVEEGESRAKELRGSGDMPSLGRLEASASECKFQRPGVFVPAVSAEPRTELAQSQVSVNISERRCQCPGCPAQGCFWYAMKSCYINVQPVLISETAGFSTAESRYI